MNKIFTVSSLEKIFPYDTPKQLESSGSAFINERYNFQLVVNLPKGAFDIRIKIDSDISNYITIRTVELIPSRFAKYPNPPHNEGYYLNHGNNELYPDLLRPIYENGGEFLRPNENVAYWFTVDGASNKLPVGKHDIKISVYDYKDVYHEIKEPELIGVTNYELEILNEELPELDVVNTCWLHYDCICDKHSVEPFTSDFYNILAKYVSNIVTHGQNMLYVPMFTPSLDTAVGTYRKTIQLVDVTVENGKYLFDFKKAKKFIKFIFNKGIKWLEFNHVATQWGAHYCPKIMATVDGEYKRIFGWDTASTSNEYGEFLDEYYKNLKVFLVKNNWENLVYFHISDEPSGDVKENFIFIKNIIKKYFPNAKCMDALSDKSLYDDGIITHPVVGLHHYEEFKSPYIYYCGGICENNITNRHFAMPSDRTRILGLQAFRNESKMFLQWAVNFYYSVLSYHEIDPYFVSDADYFFVSGDSYIVYPTTDGVLDSLRHETLCEAWQDYRALSLLASKIGKPAVLKLLDSEGVKEGFTTYPCDPIWFKKFREKVNQMIAND